MSNNYIENFKNAKKSIKSLSIPFTFALFDFSIEKFQTSDDGIKTKTYSSSYLNGKQRKLHTLKQALHKLKSKSKNQV